MYTDKSAQEIYEKSLECQKYASESSEDIREIWLQAAVEFEEAAQITQETSEIILQNKKKFIDIKTACLDFKPSFQRNPRLSGMLDEMIESCEMYLE